jgi:hypothetical protein
MQTAKANVLEDDTAKDKKWEENRREEEDGISL